MNVTSMSGKLGKYSDAVREAVLKASRGTVEDVTVLMEEFQHVVEKGRVETSGWPSSAYAVSKAGATGMTMAVARAEERRGRGVLVNACCPGYVKTDMTRGGGAKTPDQGALTPGLLAWGDIGGKAGEFWQSERVIEW